MNGYWVIRLKIQLDETPVWRRFEVNAHINLVELHEIIQVIMDWENRHLYEFKIAGERILPDEERFERPQSALNIETKLKKILIKKGQKFQYIYDLGDYWQHTIEVEEVIHRRYQDIGEDVMKGIDKKYPYCLDGEKKCPPEDVGGVEGYLQFVNSMNTKNIRYEKNIDWYGSYFNEDEFDRKKLNKKLLKVF